MIINNLYISKNSQNARINKKVYLCVAQISKQTLSNMLTLTGSVSNGMIDFDFK
jgi:hypothetical protein